MTPPIAPEAPHSADDDSTAGAAPAKLPWWRSRRGIVALAVGGVLLVGGGGAAAVTFLRGGASHVVTGTIMVTSYEGCGTHGAIDQLDRAGELLKGTTFPCPDGPGGGYKDIRDGADVVIRDGAGTIVGTSNLTDGTQQGSGVTFTFKVDGVPDADFYAVEVSHRGELRFSRAEMAANHWVVSASLG